MKARDFHKKKAVKFNSQLHWAKYKDTRNKVNSELYKAKKRYFCDNFEDCAQTKDPKQSWHHINHLLGRNFKSNNIPQLKIGDTIISDNLMIAEAFNDLFVSIGPKLSAEIDHDAQDLSENLSTSPVTLLTRSEINEYEVFLLLSNLKTSKSTGMDSIPARVFRISAEIISPSLTWISNLCIKTGVYIEDWNLNLKIGKNVKIIAQYQSYRLLVKFSKDPFSINCMNFLTLIIYFLNINLGFAQNILLWPHSSRCAMHGMRIWIMVN